MRNDTQVIPYEICRKFSHIIPLLTHRFIRDLMGAGYRLRRLHKLCRNRMKRRTFHPQFIGLINFPLSIFHFQFDKTPRVSQNIVLWNATPKNIVGFS